MLRGRTALHLAIDGGHDGVVNLLLLEMSKKRNGSPTAIKAKVNDKDESGGTLLMCAARRGNLPVVTALLKAGASVNARDKAGASALTLAAQKGYLDVVSVLKAKRGRKKEGRHTSCVTTALKLATEAGHAEVVSVLLNDKDKQGVTALARAAEVGDTYAVHRLLSGGADPDAAGTSLSCSSSHLFACLN